MRSSAKKASDHARYMREYYGRNHEKMRARTSTYAKSERGREMARRRRQNGSKLVERIKQYGLTLDQHMALFEAQDERCAICREVLDIRAACIDHDHASGKVRGLLCAKDNWALGHMDDDPSRLRAAAAYLER